MYNSVIIRIFRVVQLLPKSILENFHHRKRNFLLQFPPTHLSPSATTCLLSVSMDLPILDISY